MKPVSYSLGMLGIILLLVSGYAVAKDVEWGKLNPAFDGATFINDSGVCYGCHQAYKEKFDKTPHAKAFKNTIPSYGECESCHGPRSKHIASPSRELVLTASQKVGVCMQCHEGKERKYWKKSPHPNAGVNCVDCHTVMEAKSDRYLLTTAKEPDTCYKCHIDVQGQMNKASHHPVREGRINCSDCHNPHGSPTSGLLTQVSVNQTCYQCHQEKRGPFLMVHPPVQDNCLNCHEPHGTNNRKLQVTKETFLCLQCHSYGGHPNLQRYNRVSSPYGEGCVNCHMAIHGSNSPSGIKLTR